MLLILLRQRAENASTHRQSLTTSGKKRTHSADVVLHSFCEHNAKVALIEYDVSSLFASYNT